MYYFGKFCKIIKNNKNNALILINNKEYIVNNKLIHNFYYKNLKGVQPKFANCFYFEDLIALSQNFLSDKELILYMGYFKNSANNSPELMKTYNNLLKIYNINFNFFEKNKEYIFNEMYAYTLDTFNNLENFLDINFEKLLDKKMDNIKIDIAMKYQFLSESFFNKYIKYFNYYNIEKIIKYQTHLSPKFINKLKIYQKLVSIEY